MKIRLTPRKAGNQDRAKKTIEAILGATTQFLMEGIWENTSTNHIAEKAGVSIGSLYQYFPNKESIFKKVVEETSLKRKKEFEKLIDEALDLPQVEAYQKLVSYLTDVFFKQKRFHSFFLKNFSSPVIFSLVVQNEDDLQRMISRFIQIKHRELSADEVEQKSFLILHASLGLLRASTFFESRKIKREMVEKMLLELFQKLLG